MCYENCEHHISMCHENCEHDRCQLGYKSAKISLVWSIDKCHSMVDIFLYFIFAYIKWVMIDILLVVILVIPLSTRQISWPLC